METRELFERLVTDEPPLSFSANDVVRRGHRAATRRWSVGLAGAVVVIVMASGLAVRPSGGHRSGAVTGPTPEPVKSAVSPTPAPASGLPASFNAAGLPFLSLAQVQAAANAETSTLGPSLALMPAGGAVTGSGGRSAGKVIEKLTYGRRSFTVFVQLTVASPTDARHDFGDAVTKGPCAGTIPKRSVASGCASASLPGGGTLWTWEVTGPQSPTGAATSSGKAAVMQRSAMVVAADGSVVEVLHWAQRVHGGADIALPADHVLDEKSLVSLAEQATVTWISASRGFAGQATPTPRSPVASTVGAGPSLGGPGISALPFRSEAQITASNDAVYARLVAAAGGKAALIKGWRTLQSGRISAKTVSLRTAVQWPMGRDSAYLDVVTSTAADARSWYGPALTSGECVAARGLPSGPPAPCIESPLPGGAHAWAWQTRGAVGQPTPGQRTPSSFATVSRSVLVVARDGSTLSLTESALGGQQPYTGVATGLTNTVPDSAALVRLAAELAQAWQSAAG